MGLTVTGSVGCLANVVCHRVTERGSPHAAKSAPALWRLLQHCLYKWCRLQRLREMMFLCCVAGQRRRDVLQRVVSHVTWICCTERWHGDAWRRMHVALPQGA